MRLILEILRYTYIGETWIQHDCFRLGSLQDLVGDAYNSSITPIGDKMTFRGQNMTSYYTNTPKLHKIAEMAEIT